MLCAKRRRGDSQVAKLKNQVKKMARMNGGEWLRFGRSNAAAPFSPHIYYRYYSLKVARTNRDIELDSFLNWLKEFITNEPAKLTNRTRRLQKSEGPSCHASSFLFSSVSWKPSINPLYLTRGSSTEEESTNNTALPVAFTDGFALLKQSVDTLYYTLRRSLSLKSLKLRDIPKEYHGMVEKYRENWRKDWISLLKLLVDCKMRDNHHVIHSLKELIYFEEKHELFPRKWEAETNREAEKEIGSRLFTRAQANKSEPQKLYQTFTQCFSTEKYTQNIRLSYNPQHSLQQSTEEKLFFDILMSHFKILLWPANITCLKNLFYIRYNIVPSESALHTASPHITSSLMEFPFLEFFSKLQWNEEMFLFLIKHIFPIRKRDFSDRHSSGNGQQMTEGQQTLGGQLVTLTPSHHEIIEHLEKDDNFLEVVTSEMITYLVNSLETTSSASSSTVQDSLFFKWLQKGFTLDPFNRPLYLMALEWLLLKSPGTRENVLAEVPNKEPVCKIQTLVDTIEVLLKGHPDYWFHLVEAGKLAIHQFRPDLAVYFYKKLLALPDSKNIPWSPPNNPNHFQYPSPNGMMATALVNAFYTIMTEQFCQDPRASSSIFRVRNGEFITFVLQQLDGSEVSVFSHLCCAVAFIDKDGQHLLSILLDQLKGKFSQENDPQNMHKEFKDFIVPLFRVYTSRNDKETSALTERRLWLTKFVLFRIGLTESHPMWRHYKYSLAILFSFDQSMLNLLHACCFFNIAPEYYLNRLTRYLILNEKFHLVLPIYSIFRKAVNFKERTDDAPVRSETLTANLVNSFPEVLNYEASIYDSFLLSEESSDKGHSINHGFIMAPQLLQMSYPPNVGQLTTLLSLSSSVSLFLVTSLISQNAWYFVAEALHIYTRTSLPISSQDWPCVKPLAMRLTILQSLLTTVFNTNNRVLADQELLVTRLPQKLISFFKAYPKYLIDLSLVGEGQEKKQRSFIHDLVTLLTVQGYRSIGQLRSSRNLLNLENFGKLKPRELLLNPLIVCKHVQKELFPLGKLDLIYQILDLCISTPTELVALLKPLPRRFSSSKIRN